MRIFSLVIAGVLATGLALAGTSQAPAKAAGKTHNMTVQVVSVDVKAKTITIKDDKGETQTAPVLGRAVARLGTLKAGETVTLTCLDNDKGEHQGVSAIHTAMTAKK